MKLNTFLFPSMRLYLFTGTCEDFFLLGKVSFRVDPDLDGGDPSPTYCLDVVHFRCDSSGMV